MDWGWLGFFFAQPFHTNGSNCPEKASQRHRGNISGYSGCGQLLPCSPARSCRSRICFRLIAFPRLSFSCTDSSDAQMDKTFPEHFRQEHPPTPVNASFQMCQLCWKTGRGKDPALGAGGICYQMTLPPCAKKNRKKKRGGEEMVLLPATTFTFFPTQRSIFVGRKNHKICSEGRNKATEQPTIKNPFPYGSTA